MSNDSDHREARIVELEVRYTLQQDLLEQLSQALWEQQRLLDKLAARVEELEHRLTDSGEPEIVRTPEDYVPPHY